MGYNTDFEGQIEITPALSIQERNDVNNFCQARHDDESHLRARNSAPSIWCNWRVNLAGTALAWDGGEKAYAMDEWLQIIINSLPGHTFEGKLVARGEDFNDMWTLSATGRKASRTNGW